MKKWKATYPPAFKTVIDEDPDGFFNWHSERAEQYPASAREVLHGFCAAIQERKPVPAPILDYLCAAFADYLSGEKRIQNALHLNTPAHRPHGRTAEPDPITAVAGLHLLVRRGIKKQEAKKLISDLGVSPRNLERYDRRWRKIIETMEISELKALSRGVSASKSF